MDDVYGSMRKKGKVALVIGLGVSGRGAAKLLLKEGYDVLAVDKDRQEMEGVSVFPETAKIGPVDLAVLSPGISPKHPQAQGRCVIGEAALAFRYLNHFAIGITGTNGKTTCTLLLTHLLQTAGMAARALGNVGNSLSEYACDPDPQERLIVELSSYQLETFRAKKFDYGVLTTLSPDHLDRYDSFEAYKRVKYRLKQLVKGENFFYADSYLQLMKNGQYLPFRGSPILYVAWMISKKLGICWDVFCKGVESFKPLPHRMESVREVSGVIFINDSKGTNSGAVLYALSQLRSPIVLIAGGKGKKETFEEWKVPFRNKVKRVFAIGEIAAQLRETLENVTVCGSLEEAVTQAYAVSQRGETVLFSPGAASFDQFRNYEERGKAFIEYVNQLEEKL